MKDIGPAILEKGFFLSPIDVSEFLSGQPRDFLERAVIAGIDGRAIDFTILAQGSNEMAEKLTELRVCT
jgi:hypothetical protein